MFAIDSENDKSNNVNTKTTRLVLQSIIQLGKVRFKIFPYRHFDKHEEQ